jgi:hypothetical protein
MHKHARQWVILLNYQEIFAAACTAIHGLMVLSQRKHGFDSRRARQCAAARCIARSATHTRCAQCLPRILNLKSSDSGASGAASSAGSPQPHSHVAVGVTWNVRRHGKEVV